MKEIVIRYKGMSFRYHFDVPLRPGTEKHSHLEIIYFINGNAKFVSDDSEQDIERGTMIIIPPDKYHQFIASDTKNLKYVTVLVRAYTDEIRNLLLGMDNIHIMHNKKSPYLKTMTEIGQVLIKETESAEVRVWLYSTVMAMFAQMKRRGEILKSEPIRETHSNLVSSAINYIENNMTSDVTIEEIAATIHVSPSTLSHSFKREVGVSLYKYLLQRRLLYANKLLDSGERPTEVFYRCGFNDYSSFYRIYKNAFGMPPSGRRRRKDKKTMLYNQEEEK